MSEQLKGFSYRVLKEDCLDLPEKNWTKRQIILSSDQRKIYTEMKQTALAHLNGKVTSTMTVLTQLMRLHQITCGHFTADDGTTQEIANNRISELMNVLDELEGKAIIWANYQHDILIIIKDHWLIRMCVEDTHVIVDLQQSWISLDQSCYLD